MGLFDQMKVSEGLEHLRMLHEKETDEEKKKKIGKVLGYLNNNRDGLHGKHTRESARFGTV